MNFQITTTDEIGKLLAFVRAQAKAAFEVSPELMESCIRALREFAKEQNIRIELVTPDDQRIVAFSGGGVVAGAMIGYALAAFPGAIAGAVVGAVAGFALAHVAIRVDTPKVDGRPFMTLQVN